MNDVELLDPEVADVKETTDGEVVSIAMLLVSAILAPLGNVVDVMALPARSATVPTV